MAIKYIDYLTGDNTNDGDSWATAWKSLNGIIASRITPGDEFRYAKSPDPTSMGQNATWVGATNFLDAGTSITSSTNTTPIQIRKNTNHNLSTGDYVLINAHTVNTNANGWWQITKIDDQYFSLDGSVGNGVGGASGTFRKINNKIVKLETAVTENLCLCNYETWTPGTNVTSAAIFTTDWKCGAGSLRIVTAAGCAANQIIAKYALPSSLDLSGYEQVSFWIKSTVALAAGALEIRLYSDTACTTLVETLPIEAIPVINNWYAFALDKGSPLSATVQGIAIYTTIAQASKTFYFDNIIACKASTANDSLTLRSLIAKNEVNEYGDNVFVGLQSIQGTFLFLDNDNAANPINATGYYGVSETRTIYKREAIHYDMPSQNSFAELISESGTAENRYKILGGWNKDTNERDGLTLADCNGLGYFFQFNGRFYIDINDFHIFRALYGIRYLIQEGLVTNFYCTNCNTGVDWQNNYVTDFVNLIALNNAAGINLNYGGATRTSVLENVIANSNRSKGMQTGPTWILKNANFNNNGIGIQFDGFNGYIESIASLCCNSVQGLYVNSSGTKIKIDYIGKCNNNYRALYFSGSLVTILNIGELCNNTDALYYMSTANNDIYNIGKLNGNARLFYISGSYDCKIFNAEECIDNSEFMATINACVDFYFYNISFGFVTGDTLLSISTFSKIYFINCEGFLNASGWLGGNKYDESKIVVHNFNKEQNNHQITKNGGYILSDAVVRHSPTGISWSLSVIKTWRDYTTPLDLNVSKIACIAGETLLITAWVKKSHATDIGARLEIKAAKTTGIISDVVAIAADTTEWQLLTMTVTAIKTEVIELDFRAYWLANEADETVWIDDISITKV